VQLRYVNKAQLVMHKRSCMIQKLAHNYICFFDNVSKISESISDILWRAVTGRGFSKRELFSNDDDIIYNFKRCIGINRINLAPTKSDLVDRNILHLQCIHK
jgi:hypothetical protein